MIVENIKICLSRMKFLYYIKRYKYSLFIALILFYLLSKLFHGNKQEVIFAPVEVVKVMTKDFSYVTTFSGKTEAYNSVNIIPQVTGQITQVNFKQGSFVKSGEVLFQIDSRPFEANLKLAEAALRKNTAQLDFTEKDLVRYQSLNTQKYVSDEQYDQVKANRNSLLAAVDADKANITNAQVMLQYCKIVAPVSGIAGQISVTQGNVVQANTGTPLSTIMQITPIYIEFDVDSNSFEILRKINNIDEVPIVVKTEGGLVINDAKITFLNNEVNASTGSVTIKATYANDNLDLWSDQFVKVMVTMSQLKNAIIVPVSAVLENQNGNYVFTIDDQNKSHIKQVKLGITNDTEAQIISGLKGDEIVVTNGQLRLAEGSEVKIINEESIAK